MVEDLRRVLSTMASHVNATTPRVPNPVNPAEDFADKWGDAACRHLQLEENFRRWLRKAQADFQALEADTDESASIRRINESFRTAMSSRNLAGAASVGSLLRSPAAPSSDLSFPPKPLVPNKPAGFASVG